MAKLLVIVVLSLFTSAVTAVLPNYSPVLQSDGMTRDEIIESYFRLGLSAKEIALFLVNVHGIHICLRQLKRILRYRGCRRRQPRSDLNEVIEAVEEELRGSGSIIGYRALHQRLIINHGLVTSRDIVRQVVKALDPEGVELRSRHRLQRRVYRANGPNYLWHIDGYDKLKPFGFCVHGAIDGYSRRIIWLEVASSNNDPRIVAKYFLDYVRQIGGTARIIRGDRGTENGSVAGIQRFFRRSTEDAFSGEKSFMYGRSTSNQRIEAWWGILRKACADWWINLFKDLRDSGLYFDDDDIHRQCLKFCFMGVIQRELDIVAQNWNVHRIRPSTNLESPPGRPDILYFVPESVHTHDYITPINVDEIDIAEEMCAARPPANGCSPHFTELAEMIMEDEGLQTPATASEGMHLYNELLRLIAAIDVN